MSRRNIESLETTEELYLVLIDFFMLLSAMGVTLGIVFIVLKLEFWSAKYGIPLLTSTEITISDDDYLELGKDVSSTPRTIESLFAKIESNEIKSNDENKYFRINDKGSLVQVDLIEADKIKDDERARTIPHLRITSTYIQADSVKLKLVFYRKDGSYTTKSDINELNQEVRKWPILEKTIQEYQKRQR